MTNSAKISERFMGKVLESMSQSYNGTACWEWTGYKNPGGYGTFWIIDSNRLAHRVSYYLFRDSEWDISDSSLNLDHLCRNRGCVNPLHLESVDMKTNILRGVGPTAVNAQKTCCIRGHIFTPDNTIISKQGSRVCRTCSVLRKRVSNQRNRIKRAEYNRQWLARHPGYYEKYRKREAGL